MRTILWDITNECNLRCKHCYNNEYQKEEKITLSNEDISTIINKLKGLQSNKISFLGGEPLLSPNIITALSIANSNNIFTTITTNGTLLTENMVNALYNNGLNDLIVSIDGIDKSSNDAIRGQGSFDLAIKNLKKAMQLRDQNKIDTKIYFSLSLNHINKEYARDMVEFVSGLGVDGFLVSYIEKEGSADANWDSIGISASEAVVALEDIVKSKHKYPNLYMEVICKKKLMHYLIDKYDITNYYNHSKPTYCNGIDEEFYINPSGDIFPCRKVTTRTANYMIEKGLYRHQDYPNIITNTVDEILESKYNINFFNFARDSSNYDISEYCQTCDFFKDCKPCPFHSHSNYIPEECIEAQKLRNLYDNKILQNKLRFIDNLCSDKVRNEFISFYDMKDNKYINVELDDLNMLSTIVENQEITENSIKSYYDSKYDETIVSYEEFKDDFLDFVYALLKYKIVEIS